MRKDVIVPALGIVLLAVCCAGPFLFGGVGAAVVLALAHVQPSTVIVAPLAAVAFIAAGLGVRARRSKNPGSLPDLAGVCPDLDHDDRDDWSERSLLLSRRWLTIRGGPRHQ
jgi:hypothetical protein